MFERFTEEAMQVVFLAQEEARRLGQTQQIGSAFLLLGLIREGRGVAAQVLTQMGVGLQIARHEVEQTVGRGANFPLVETPFSQNATSVLTQALQESQRLGHPMIGTEHLLLAIATLKQGVAYQVLQNLQVDAEQLQSEILATMSEAELSKYDFVPAPTQDLKELAQDLDRLIEQMSEMLTIAKSKSEILKRKIRSRSQLHSDTIDSIPKLPNSPEGNATKQSLSELRTAIETDEQFTDEDKAEMLAQIQFLASLWIGRLDERVQKANRRSLRMLRGFIAELPNDAPQLAIYQRLVSTIAEQFQL
ncbi:ATP-dependent Clp protease, regulatory subunit [Leptolyngbya sp. NIES-3755]|nr:ATP-dependent Clp protease, regulatory subunit [Leptolyngbya sp. NIES-3755]